MALASSGALSSRHTVGQSRPSAAALRAAPSRRRLVVSAVAAPFREEEAVAQQADLSAAAVAAAASRGRVVLESADELRSTWVHRAWVGGATALMAGTLATGLAQVDSSGAAVSAGAAALAAYFLADVGTAFYHW